MLSDLAIFREGLTDLAPGAKILCYWDKLGNLLPMIQEGRLEREISVTAEYQDLTGGYRSHEWAIAPGATRDSEPPSTRARPTS